MSGHRLHNLRQGDRSEYLAVYILSALGLVTQVPRQEDIGYDLVCNLAEQESGILSFRNHFAVSIKSFSTPRAVFVPPESKEKDGNYTEHFNWLFHLELPLMLGVVNKKKQELALYSTLPAWFVFYEQYKNCGIIELVPRTANDGSNPNVDHPKDCGPDARAAGRSRFEVDLGFPIAIFNIQELGDKELVKAKKASLRRAIEFGAETARFAQMGTPYFWWFNLTQPDGYIAGKTNPDGYNGGVAWYVGTCKDEGQLQRMMGGLAPGLMSAALLFKQLNQKAQLESLREAMRILPNGTVPAEVQKALPEVYG